MRRTLASFSEAGALIGMLREQSRALLPRAHGCQLMVGAHASQFESDELDAEFGYAVEHLDLRDPPRGSALQLRDLPEVRPTAVCVRVGLPEHAHLATAKIAHPRAP